MQSQNKPIRKELHFEMRRSLEIPSCKPFRLLELIAVLFSFFILFFLRKYDSKDKDVINYLTFLYFFTAIGSTLVVTFVDVMLQALRIPISNNPMIFGTSLSCLFCFTAAVTALTIVSQHENDENYRTLALLRVLSGICFFSSLIYILDLLILIRYSCHYEENLS